MTYTVRKADPGFILASSPKDFKIIEDTFSGVHRLHCLLTKKLGLDVYKEEVSNISLTEFRLLAPAVKYLEPLFLKFMPIYIRLAEDSDGIAQGALYAEEEKNDPTAIRLDNIGVRDNNTNVAKTLVDNFIMWASNKGYHTITSEVLVNNHWSISLLKQGYGVEPAELVLATNIEHVSPDTTTTNELPESRYFDITKKVKTTKSWDKYNSLTLEFKNTSADTPQDVISDELARISGFARQNGYGIVQVSIAPDNTDMKEILEAEGWTPFKYKYEI